MFLWLWNPQCCWTHIWLPREKPQKHNQCPKLWRGNRITEPSPSITLPMMWGLLHAAKCVCFTLWTLSSEGTSYQCRSCPLCNIREFLLRPVFFPSGHTGWRESSHFLCFSQLGWGLCVNCSDWMHGWVGINSTGTNCSPERGAVVAVKTGIIALELVEVECSAYHNPWVRPRELDPKKQRWWIGYFCEV